MEIWRPEAPEPTPSELKELDRLKATINAAVADGKISRGEMEAIRTQARADGKITVAELELYRTLVTDKIAAGELEYEWSRG